MKNRKDSKQMLFEMMEKVNPDFKLSNDIVSDVKERLTTLLNNNGMEVIEGDLMNSDRFQEFISNPELLKKVVMISVDNERKLVNVDFKHVINGLRNRYTIDSKLISTYFDLIKNEMSDCEVGLSGFTVMVQPKEI